MRAMQWIVALSLLICSGAVALAQHPASHFRPGEWQIDSVTTVAGGRTITSSTRVCARKQMDFWKVAQTGLTCKPPKTHLETSGVLRVHVHCEYEGEKLHSDIRTIAIETFADHGNSFTLTGTTTTDTVYQGVQPKHTSAQLQTTARRVGDCH
jgi:hypothetical protein